MAPKDINELNLLLQKNSNNLSKKMRLIAIYIIDQPQQIALNTLADIASDIGVYPSTLVRFAKHLGFDGFSQLQKLFKVRISKSAINYRKRITEVKNVIDGHISTSSESIFYDTINKNIIATELLPKQIPISLIEDTVNSLNMASEVIVCGMSRAYPVATYFNYMLNNLGIKCRMIDSSEDTSKQSHWFNEKTVLIAITYNPYSAITMETVKIAKKKNSKIILVTDTVLNPVANISDYLFLPHEAEIHTFRSLNATFCIAQAICVAIGYNRQKENK